MKKVCYTCLIQKSIFLQKYNRLCILLCISSHNLLLYMFTTTVRIKIYS